MTEKVNLRELPVSAVCSASPTNPVTPAEARVKKLDSIPKCVYDCLNSLVTANFNLITGVSKVSVAEIKEEMRNYIGDRAFPDFWLAAAQKFRDYGWADVAFYGSDDLGYYEFRTHRK